MKRTPITTIRDAGRRDRRLEIMLGVACLMLAAACLLLASVVGWRSFLSSPKAANSAKPAGSASVSSSTAISNGGSNTNDLQLRAAVAQQLHNATCCDSLRGDKVAVNVNRGVATLTGTVTSVGERNSAGFLAGIVMGVKGVNNEIVVSATTAKVPLPAAAQRRTQEAGNTTRPQRPQQTIHRSTPEADEAAELKTWVDLGNSRLDSGDYAGAIRYFNLALALDPGNKDAITGLRRAKSAQRTEKNIVKRSV